MSSVSYELSLLKQFYDPDSVFALWGVSWDLRSTWEMHCSVLIMLYVVVISYQSFGTTDWSHLDLRIHDS
jgi:hypothetical protein